MNEEYEKEKLPETDKELTLAEQEDSPVDTAQPESREATQKGFRVGVARIGRESSRMS